MIIRDKELIRILTNEERHCVILNVNDTEKKAKISNSDFTKMMEIDYNFIKSVLSSTY